MANTFAIKNYLTVRANCHVKMRMAFSSRHEHKNHSNSRTSRRQTGSHDTPHANAGGCIIGQPLPTPWPLARMEPGEDDGRVVGLYPVRGRPPTRSRRAVGHHTPAPPQAAYA